MPAPVPGTNAEHRRSRTIEVRGYDLWEVAGRPEGDSARVGFRLKAENEIKTAHTV